MNRHRQNAFIASIQSLVLVCLLIAPSVFADDSPVVTAQILPVSQFITAGQPVEVAVIFTMTDGWHTYWQNPGEAGIPTTFDWTLPPGFSLISMQEPVPLRHVDDGITTFIHEEEAIYLFQFKTPPEIPDTIQFDVKIDWLECKSICRAGHAKLSLTMPSGGTSDLALASKRMGENAQSQFAAPGELVGGHVSRHRDLIIVNTKAFVLNGGKIVDVDFFPIDEMIYDIGRKPELRSRFGSQTIRIPLLSDLEDVPETLHGVLKITQGSGDDLIISHHLLNETIK
jgi:hypothetical protein